MIDQLVAVVARDVFLQLLDLLVDKLDYGAGIYVDHVIVMLFASELVNGVSVIEVVALNDTGLGELGEHPIHGCQPNGLFRVQEVLVDILGRQMVRIRLLKHFQHFEARQSDFQSGAFEIVARHGELLLVWPKRGRVH